VGGGCGVYPIGCSGQGPLAGCYEYGDEPWGYGATELVAVIISDCSTGSYFKIDNASRPI
jgi:hypothetical protein